MVIYQPSEIKEELQRLLKPEEVVIEEEPAAIEELEETEQVTEQEEIEEEVEEELEERRGECYCFSSSRDTKARRKDDDIVEEKNTEIESLKKEIKRSRNLLLYQGLEDVLHKVVVVKFV